MCLSSSLTLASIFRIYGEIEFYSIEETILLYFYYEVTNVDHVDIEYWIFLGEKIVRMKDDRCSTKILPEIDQRILSFTNNQVVRLGYNYEKEIVNEEKFVCEMI